jgi:ribose transport system substrate-binding protein
VTVVGFDEDPATLQGVADEYVFATVVQDPYRFGFETVTLMAKLAKGEKFTGDPVRYIPYRVVTKDGGPGRLAVGPFREEILKYLRSQH